MPGPKAEQFMNALRELEQSREVERMTALFAGDAEASNVTDNMGSGDGGAEHFWKAYLESFQEVSSEFRNAAEDGDLVMLEWTSRGRLRDGQPFEYDGVSVVEFSGDEVRRFRAYFDPSAVGHVRRGAEPSAGG